MARFQVDVSPPLGSPLCYSLVVPAERIESPLWAKGVVLYPDGQKPIVLCAVDWLGIGGKSHQAWRGALAQACRTEPSRVAVQTVHQHDAPGADAGAHELLAARGLGELLSPDAFCRQALKRVAQAAGSARPVKISHLGAGRARVERIASNRRILDPSGEKFLFQRFTACRGSEFCAAPEGLIDPELKCVSFYQGDARVASLHYYATHPMSHYGKGAVNADFVGLARDTLPGFHVYFTGAAGNIGAGKYNDGAPERRGELAGRLREAMKSALANETKSRELSLTWKAEDVLLPHREGAEFGPAAIKATLENDKATPRDRASAARYLAWWEACQARQPICFSALAFTTQRILHLPGELFVEYQLRAQKESHDLPCAMAAYGDYGPMYIGTRQSYSEGGYETSLVSRVDSGAEELICEAMLRLMGR